MLKHSKYSKMLKTLTRDKNTPEASCPRDALCFSLFLAVRFSAVIVSVHGPVQGMLIFLENLNIVHFGKREPSSLSFPQIP